MAAAMSTVKENVEIGELEHCVDEKVDQPGPEDEEDEETKRAVRRLKWKLDLYILPLLSIVYLFSSMGRSDLGNAKIAGLTDELKLSAQDYSTAANMFLVGYIVFQLPGTLLIRKIGPSLQFGLAMILWGTFTAASVAVTNRGTLFALRFLVGTAEAFIQGAVFYLSFWYTYRELATRGAIFFSASTLAGAFNGLIAYAITKNLDGSHGWRAWRWIFLIEGIMPIAFSIVVLIMLPSSPDKVRFGFTQEKDLAMQRSLRAHNNFESKLELKKVPLVLMSVSFWLFAVIACAGHYCLSSLANFLPAIIQGFGYSSVNAQLFTVIVYACAFVGIIFWARVADRTNARGLTLAASGGFSVLGYALLLGLTDSRGRFAATCLLAFGIYANITLQLSWMTMSFVGYTKRGSSLAFINIFSQMFSIAGNYSYIDPPYYRIGNASSLGLAALYTLTSLALSWYLRHLNVKKRMNKHSAEAAQQRLKSMEELGNSHPDFYYTT